MSTKLLAGDYADRGLCPMSRCGLYGMKCCGLVNSHRMTCWDAFADVRRRTIFKYSATCWRFWAEEHLTLAQALTICTFSVDDVARLLPLNQRFMAEMSPLTPDRASRLIASAVYARQIAAFSGFIIGLDAQSDYDGVNFLWLKARCQRFVYVDRIAVEPRLHGRGLARALYEDLFAWARIAGYARIVCEVNIRPENLASLAFHERFGFKPIGRASRDDGAKIVQFLEYLL